MSLDNVKNTLPKNVLYYGKIEDLPEQVMLNAGPLTVMYENGDIRYVKYGDHEIIRRVYATVRNHNWNTIEHVLSNVKIESHDSSFQISYDAHNKSVRDSIDYSWKGRISGDSQGTITFSMDGEAHTTFRKNRLGFCVLNPIKECAGVPCELTHVNGSTTKTEFPLHIDPGTRVFQNMKSMRWEINQSLQAEIIFAGDEFDMEDQRNWTDASYKTFCTPLNLPYPVEIKKGTKLHQQITLSLIGEAPPITSKAAGLHFTIPEITPGNKQALPRIGVGLATKGKELSAKEIERIKALHFNHLRVDLDLENQAYVSVLKRGWNDAYKLGIALDLALHISQQHEQEINNLIATLQELKPSLHTFLIFQKGQSATQKEIIHAVKEPLKKAFPKVSIGCGTNCYFTELNRERPPVEEIDLTTYSLNPQLHAFDNTSLLETHEAQQETVVSCRSFVGKLPIYVSPITMKPRFNADATEPEPEAKLGELPSQVDVRQMSQFGAVWTLGSLKALCETNVDSVTYYETAGWRGIMETDSGSPLPEIFRSLPGMVYPMYHVLADFNAWPKASLITSTSSDPLSLNGLVLQNDDGALRVIVANMKHFSQKVTLAPLGKKVSVRWLDERTAAVALFSPETYRNDKGETKDTNNGVLELELLPYGVATIDVLEI